MAATVGLSGEVATAPVCEALGLSRAALYRRLRKYGIDT